MKALTLLAFLISSNAMALEYKSPNKIERACPSLPSVQRALKSAEQLLAVRPACSEADLGLQNELVKLHQFLSLALKNHCLKASSAETVREATRDLVKQATQIHNCR
jgi:hypothetical protein